MSFTRSDTYDGLPDAQVLSLADRHLAEAERLLEAGWFGQPLTHHVENLRFLASEYSCVEGRMRQEPEFAERFELVVAAWKDRPGA